MGFTASPRHVVAKDAIDHPHALLGLSGHAYDEIDAAARLSEDTEAQMGEPGVLNHPDAFQFNRLTARLLEQV
jgi:hypothetical protein